MKNVPFYLLEIAKRLRAERIKAEPSMRKFAKKCGITPQALSGYETGQRKLSTKALTRLFEAGLDTEYIQTGLTQYTALIRPSGAPELKLDISSKYIQHMEDEIRFLREKIGIQCQQISDQINAMVPHEKNQPVDHRKS